METPFDLNTLTLVEIFIDGKEVLSELVGTEKPEDIQQGIEYRTIGNSQAKELAMELGLAS